MNIEFPQPPKAMAEMFNSQMTYEQQAFIKLLEKKALTHDEIISLNEANQFFKTTFNFLHLKNKAFCD
ncbi:MAG: hypothetical protein IPL21_13935 [Saprospirales bacterium]|nr:hypothetical protein [Saprospirales bacterium]